MRQFRTLLLSAFLFCLAFPQSATAEAPAQADLKGNRYLRNFIRHAATIRQEIDLLRYQGVLIPTDLTQQILRDEKEVWARTVITDLLRYDSREAQVDPRNPRNQQQQPELLDTKIINLVESLRRASQLLLSGWTQNPQATTAFKQQYDKTTEAFFQTMAALPFYIEMIRRGYTITGAKGGAKDVDAVFESLEKIEEHRYQLLRLADTISHYAIFAVPNRDRPCLACTFGQYRIKVRNTEAMDFIPVAIDLGGDRWAKDTGGVTPFKHGENKNFTVGYDYDFGGGSAPHGVDPAAPQPEPQRFVAPPPVAPQPQQQQQPQPRPQPQQAPQPMPGQRPGTFPFLPPQQQQPQQGPNPALPGPGGRPPMNPGMPTPGTLPAQQPTPPPAPTIPQAQKPARPPQPTDWD